MHNAKALHCGRVLAKFPQVVTELAHILQRFLDALDCVDSACIADDSFDQLTQPGCVGQTRVAGVDLNNPRMRAVIEAVLALAAAPQGFLVAAVAAKPIQTNPPERLTSLDTIYRTLQGDMCQLFQLLGITVQTA